MKSILNKKERRKRLRIKLGRKREKEIREKKINRGWQEERKKKGEKKRKKDVTQDHFHKIETNKYGNM